MKKNKQMPIMLKLLIFTVVFGAIGAIVFYMRNS